MWKGPTYWTEGSEGINTWQPIAVQEADIGIPGSEGYCVRTTTFPQCDVWLLSRFQGLLTGDRNCVLARGGRGCSSVAPAPPSIHLSIHTSMRTPSLGPPSTPMGSDGKPVEGTSVGGRHGSGQDKGICDDGEGRLFPSLLAHPPCPPSSPFSPTALGAGFGRDPPLPSRVRRPNPASSSPPRFVSIHLIRWRSGAEIDFTEGK